MDPASFTPPSGSSIVLAPGVNRLVFRWAAALGG
jgi:hypothetical protein